MKYACLFLCLLSCDNHDRRDRRHGELLYDISCFQNGQTIYQAKRVFVYVHSSDGPTWYTITDPDTWRSTDVRPNDNSQFACTVGAVGVYSVPTPTPTLAEGLYKK